MSANKLHVTSQWVVGADNGAVPGTATLVQYVRVVAVQVHGMARRKRVRIQRCWQKGQSKMTYGFGVLLTTTMRTEELV
jgi:hypothetical protein